MLTRERESHQRYTLQPPMATSSSDDDDFSESELEYPESNIAAAAPSPPSGNSSTSPQPRPQGEDHFVGDAQGSSAYGRMAGEDDCNSEGPVADVLRTNGRLRTVSDLIEEEREWKRKVAMLADQIEVKNERLLDMESRYNAATISIQVIMEDTDKIKLKHMEEMRRLQRETYESSLRVFRENEM